jgi:hypothetical protein
MLATYYLEHIPHGNLFGGGVVSSLNREGFLSGLALSVLVLYGSDELLA